MRRRDSRRGSIRPPPTEKKGPTKPRKGVPSGSSELSAVNVVLVGDTFCGKTNLLFSYAKNEFITTYQQTMFDHYNLGEVLKVNGSQKKHIKLSVWDVSGSESHASLRKFAYSKADAIIFCFDLADGKHFDPKAEKHRKDYEDEKKKNPDS